MDVTRIAEAQAYEAPLHFDVRSLRLQGMEASDTGFAWVGLSHFLPGGGCEMSATPLAKIYVVTQGEITVELADGVTHRLTRNDSCHIPAGEARAVRNDTNEPASMLVVMPYRVLAEDRP